jgi:hypothetical protein
MWLELLDLLSIRFCTIGDSRSFLSVMGDEMAYRSARSGSFMVDNVGHAIFAAIHTMS